MHNLGRGQGFGCNVEEKLPEPRRDSVRPIPSMQSFDGGGKQCDPIVGVEMDY